MRALFLILNLSILPVRAGASPPTAVLLRFDNATRLAELDSLRSGVPDFLTAFLSPHSDQIRILERDELNSIMEEQGLKWENITAAKSDASSSRLSQARYVIGGSITEDGDALHVQALLYETETMRVRKSFSAQDRRTRFAPMLEKLALGILDGLASIDEKSKDAPQQLDTDPETNLHMISGLGYYHHGLYSKAIPEFMKILARRPRHATAQYWLVKSYWAAGLREHAAEEAREFLASFPQDARSNELREVRP